jgi:FkbM family methyltransferase
VFPTGAVRRVLWGPCRGMRYRIFPAYGHAYLYGGWERKSMELMAQYVKPGSVAYDLGANYGMHTLFLAKLVGISGRVYAFEPNPEIFSALNEQLSLNDFHVVNTVLTAVADEVGTACFDRAQHRGAGHLVPATAVSSGTTFHVRTTTLDKFVFQDHNAPPDFVKVDIEGAESAALRGGLGVIAQHRPIFMIELHSPMEDRAVGTILKSFGYTAIRVQNGQAVENMESGWPDSNGMWGTVIAHPSFPSAH